MKKAFTMAETVITACILGVIASIVIPVVNNVQPNKDITMYPKALLTLQSAMPNVLEEAEAISAGAEGYRPEDFLKNLTRKQFCELVADNVNTVGEINCNINDSYTKPNFKTEDGLVFWNFCNTVSCATTKFTQPLSGLTEECGSGVTDSCKVIYVDYNLSNADRKRRQKAMKDNKITGLNNWDKGKEGLKLIVRKDGKVFVPSPEKETSSKHFGYENKIIELSNNKK